MTNYGYAMAAKRNAAKQARMAQREVTRPSERTAVNPPKLRLHPMDQHDGSTPDRPIDWSANTEQAETLARRIQRENLTILDLPTGMGKTILSLDAFDRYRQTVNGEVPCIIVAPSKVLQGKGWHRAVAAFNAEHPDRPINPVMMESYERMTAIIDNPTTKKVLLREMMPKGVVLVDEMHNYKSPTSKRAKALKKIQMFKILGMTATPLTNDPIMDQISYLVLSGRYTSKTNFLKVSGLDEKLDMWGNFTVYDSKNKRVNRGAWPYYDTMVAEFADVLYAPDVDMSDVVMPDVSQRLIQLPADEELDGQWKSLLDARKKHAFDTPVDFMMSTVEMLMTSPARLRELVRIIDQPGVVQPLVFYSNNVALEAIISALGDRSIQVVSGDSSNAPFDARRLDTVVLIQYQAGGAGIEFPDSNTSVFYQNQYSYSMLEQAKGRNRRRGRDHQVQHYYMIASNLFDAMVFNRLSDRGDVTESVMADLLDKELGK